MDKIAKAVEGEKREENKAMRGYYFTKSDTAIAKLIAILIMITHHLFGFANRIMPEHMYQSFHMYEGQPIEAVICGSFKICVALFLFLSGYGTYVSVRKKKNISKAIANKIKGLLLFVWQVMLIFVPIDYFLGVTKVNITSTWEIQYDLKSIILSMLGFEKFNGEWWFVMPYIVLLMMTPLLIRFLKRQKADFFTDFLITFGLAMFSVYGVNKLMTYGMFESFAPSVWGILFCNVMYLLPIYLMGMLFAKYQVFSYFYRISPKSVLRYPVWIFVAFGSMYLRYKFNGGTYDFLLAGPMIFGLVCTLRDIPGVVWVSGKASRYITLVWLTHSFYIFQFGQGIVYASHNPIVICIVEILLAFGTAFGIYWLFYWLRRIWNMLMAGGTKNAG